MLQAFQFARVGSPRTGTAHNLFHPHGDGGGEQQGCPELIALGPDEGGLGGVAAAA